MNSSKPSISGDSSVIELDAGEKEGSSVEKEISVVKRTSSVMPREIKSSIYIFLFFL